MQTSLFIVIVGCGRIGTYLADTLSQAGHSVVAIDADETTFASLSGEFSGFKIEGDATEMSVLTAAKVDKADALIAVTNDDNTNIMVAQLAKTMLHVPRVIVRVFDRQLAAFYQDSGVTAICPTTIVGDLFLQAVTGATGVNNDKDFL